MNRKRRRRRRFALLVLLAMILAAALGIQFRIRPMPARSRGNSGRECSIERAGWGGEPTDGRRHGGLRRTHLL